MKGQTVSIRSMLAGTDLRSVGASAEVARVVVFEPARFGEAIALMEDEDPVIRMRASDAVEKASRTHPQLLAPFARDLLGPLADCEQQEVRWHILMMLPRLPLSEADTRRAWLLAQHSLIHPSRIVNCEAVSAMHALSKSDPRLRKSYKAAIQKLAKKGSPSVQARIRRLRRLDADE